MIKRKRSHFQWHSKSQVVQDADIQSYLMQAQLDKMGANLKASVKEEVEDDTSGLGWAMDGAAAEEDWGQEVEEYDEEIEEEEVEDGNDQEEDGEDQEEDRHSWTMKDWEATKAAGAKAMDDVVDVELWDSQQHSLKERWSQPSKDGWKIKAPWAAKPSKQKAASFVRKTDKWGGQCWSDGWYKDREGQWWPQLSNNFGGLSFVCCDPPCKS